METQIHWLFVFNVAQSATHFLTNPPAQEDGFVIFHDVRLKLFSLKPSPLRYSLPSGSCVGQQRPSPGQTPRIRVAWRLLTPTMLNDSKHRETVQTTSNNMFDGRHPFSTDGGPAPPVFSEVSGSSSSLRDFGVSAEDMNHKRHRERERE